MGDSELVEFKVGKIVCGRWKVTEKLGSGGCGAVYEVIDINRKNYSAALKVESNNVEDGGVLKLEAEVLRKLKDRKKVIRLIHAGKRNKYSFIVMTICGPDLMLLKRINGVNANKREKDRFSEETTMRIGVHCLYAIKQVHEIGYVHRDVKPGNMVVGMQGRDSRIIFMIDYGMVRSFVCKDEKTGKLTIRKPRKRVLLRGTLRYCSTNVHKRLEQGRVDDIWSLIFMLIELHVGLPWTGIKDEEPLQKIKETVTDDRLYQNCPPEFRLIAGHLRTLKYEDRPNYKLVYDHFITGIKRLKTNFSKAYDWEDDKDLENDAGTAMSVTEGRDRRESVLTSEQLEYKMYPTTNPVYFEENILGF